MLDNILLGQTDAAALAVVATNVAPGWHEAVAQAFDDNGLSSLSSVVHFFVNRGEK